MHLAIKPLNWLLIYQESFKSFNQVFKGYSIRSVFGILLWLAGPEWFSTQRERFSHLSLDRCCHALWWSQINKKDLLEKPCCNRRKMRKICNMRWRISFCFSYPASFSSCFFAGHHLWYSESKLIGVITIEAFGVSHELLTTHNWGGNRGTQT